MISLVLIMTCILSWSADISSHINYVLPVFYVELLDPNSWRMHAAVLGNRWENDAVIGTSRLCFLACCQLDWFYVQHLNIILWARLVKKVVVILCIYIAGVEGGGESRNPSHKPVIYQSWPFSTKCSNLTCQYLPETENCMDSSLFFLKVWHEFKAHLKSDRESVWVPWQPFQLDTSLMCKSTLSARSLSSRLWLPDMQVYSPRRIPPRGKCMCYLSAIRIFSHLSILHCYWLIVCWLADCNTQLIHHL